MKNLIEQLLTLATNVAGRLVGAILILVIGKFAIKAIIKAIKKSKFIEKSEITVAHFLMNFINIALNVVVVISVIAVLGVPMASVVTVIASAGVAVGLALQGSLSNLAGGIMILIFKPFKIGNFVEISGSTGTVLDIGIFYTVIQTPDNKEITIPNGTVMANAITNYSAHDTRRVDFTFSVAYGTDIEKVKNILLDESSKHNLVLSEPEPFARMSSNGSSSMDFTLKVWTKSEDYWTVNFDIIEAVNKRFSAENIEIPFNQIDVHVNNI